MKAPERALFEAWKLYTKKPPHSAVFIEIIEECF